MGGLFSGKPRDPARIGPTLQKIAEVWRRNPDMRLGQLITNLTPPGADPYFVEDDAFVSGALFNRLMGHAAEGVSPRVETNSAGATVDTPDAVERVARALCQDAGDDPDGRFIGLDNKPVAGWTLHEREARAAIAAMPHPPEVVRLIEAARAVEEEDGFAFYKNRLIEDLRAALTPFRSETGS